MLPKVEAGRPERAPRTFPGVSEATASGADNLAVRKSSFPKQANVTDAKLERAKPTIRGIA